MEIAKSELEAHMANQNYEKKKLEETQTKLDELV
jgi:hypothetical protein